MATKLIYLVLETLGEPWDWNRLSANPNIDQEDVLNFPDLPWNWRFFSMNPNLRFEFVLEHAQHYDWDWTALSENPAINWNHVSTYPTLPWNRSVLAYNRNIRVETLLAEGLPNASKSVNLRFHHVLSNPTYPWNWYDVTTNRGAWTMEDLRAHIELPWVWSSVSSSCEITRDLLATPGLPWDYSSLSFNPSVTLDLIDAFPLIPWDWTRVSQNPNLTLDYVLAHPERPWDWDLINYSMPMLNGVSDFRRRADVLCDPPKLSYNPSVQLRDVLENLDLQWLPDGLSKNLVFTATDLRQMQSVLNWSLVSMNPCLRLETIVELRSAPWDWAELSSHRFGV